MLVLAWDLDDVLCRRDANLEHLGVEKYRCCKPMERAIDALNWCYDQGAKIVIYTARGMNQFQGDVTAVEANLRELTEQQLEDWGVKYHELVMGKVHYDLLIDDKSTSLWQDAKALVLRGRRSGFVPGE